MFGILKRINPISAVLGIANPGTIGAGILYGSMAKGVVDGFKVKGNKGEDPQAPGTPGMTDAQMEEEKAKAEYDLRRRLAGQGRAANILAGANPNLMEAPSARRTLLGGQ